MNSIPSFGALLKKATVLFILIDRTEINNLEKKITAEDVDKHIEWPVFRALLLPRLFCLKTNFIYWDIYKVTNQSKCAKNYENITQTVTDLS